MTQVLLSKMTDRESVVGWCYYSNDDNNNNNNDDDGRHGNNDDDEGGGGANKANNTNSEMAGLKNTNSSNNDDDNNTTNKGLKYRISGNSTNKSEQRVAAVGKCKDFTSTINITSASESSSSKGADKTPHGTCVLSLAKQGRFPREEVKSPEEGDSSMHQERRGRTKDRTSRSKRRDGGSDRSQSSGGRASSMDFIRKVPVSPFHRDNRDQQHDSMERQRLNNTMRARSKSSNVAVQTLFSNSAHAAKTTSHSTGTAFKHAGKSSTDPEVFSITNGPVGYNALSGLNTPTTTRSNKASMSNAATTSNAPTTASNAEALPCCQSKRHGGSSSSSTKPLSSLSSKIKRNSHEPYFDTQIPVNYVRNLALRFQSRGFGIKGQSGGGEKAGDNDSAGNVVLVRLTNTGEMVTHAAGDGGAGVGGVSGGGGSPGAVVSVSPGVVVSQSSGTIDTNSSGFDPQADNQISYIEVCAGEPPMSISSIDTDSNRDFDQFHEDEDDGLKYLDLIPNLAKNPDVDLDASDIIATGKLDTALLLDPDNNNAMVLSEHSSRRINTRGFIMHRSNTDPDITSNNGRVLLHDATNLVYSQNYLNNETDPCSAGTVMIKASHATTASTPSSSPDVGAGGGCGGGGSRNKQRGGPVSASCVYGDCNYELYNDNLQVEERLEGSGLRNAGIEGEPHSINNNKVMGPSAPPPPPPPPPAIAPSSSHHPQIHPPPFTPSQMLPNLPTSSSNHHSDSSSDSMDTGASSSFSTASTSTRPKGYVKGRHKSYLRDTMQFSFYTGDKSSSSSSENGRVGRVDRSRGEEHRMSSDDSVYMTERGIIDNDVIGGTPGYAIEPGLANMKERGLVERDGTGRCIAEHDTDHPYQHHHIQQQLHYQQHPASPIVSDFSTSGCSSGSDDLAHGPRPGGRWSDAPSACPSNHGSYSSSQRSHNTLGSCNISRGHVHTNGCYGQRGISSAGKRNISPGRVSHKGPRSPRSPRSQSPGGYDDRIIGHSSYTEPISRSLPDIPPQYISDFEGLDPSPTIRRTRARTSTSTKDPKVILRAAHLSNELVRLKQLLERLHPRELQQIVQQRLGQRDSKAIVALGIILPRTAFPSQDELHCVRCHKNYNVRQSSACTLKHPSAYVVRTGQDARGAGFYCKACDGHFTLQGLFTYDENINSYIAGFCFNGQHSPNPADVNYSGIIRTCEEHGCVECYV